ncbi:hypothetical protein [Paracoccus ravus]|uniref:hypothetical protein n=1 Tax=Paracoccus ravus TaxID=2447760 RepID=UPI00106E52A6|nr:hypothetical protein [Paracoccus ravus]
MSLIFAANESAVLVNGEPVLGVQSLEYRRVRERSNVYSVGGAERVAVVTGREKVEIRLSVASTWPPLDELGWAEEPFAITAQLRSAGGETTVSFDEVLISEKTFAMPVSGRGETVYEMTATRVREG